MKGFRSWDSRGSNEVAGVKKRECRDRTQDRMVSLRYCGSRGEGEEAKIEKD